MDLKVPSVVRVSRAARVDGSVPRRILSVDVGIRNLGLALIEVLAGEQPEQTTAFAPFLANRVRVLHAENVDVLEENGCNARNAKAVGMLRHVHFWHACVFRRTELLLLPAPDVVVVEVQDAHNGAMRAMAANIVSSLLMMFEMMRRTGNIDAVPMFDTVRGDKKMRVCDELLGCAAEAETVDAAEDAPSSPSPAPPPALPSPAPPAYMRRTNPRLFFARAKKGGQGGKAKAYEARKRRAVDGLQEMIRSFPDASGPLAASWRTLTQKKQRDVADAVLQGVWIAWDRIGNKRPPKRKRSS